MSSEKNLEAAFAGESMANRRYLAFAEKAEKEGFKNVARIFRTAAESETIHAINHLKVMGGIKETLENLKVAFEGETYEKEEMYPKFIEEAKKEGNKQAERTFTWAIEAEKVHAELYKRAIAAVEQGKDVEVGDLYICEVCGFTVEGEVPEKCPVCGAKADKFRKVE
ncbi:Rubrerythrin [Archaeoglobus sulfaticallidus PM70-1]|uniref:Rubrerythrin n=1 Tax=Archaeoglobus sulfaticallidus PM70-1 TaxID=387631 RepID=N0BD69_9EURY|nr:rubrerythrin family protein [Archaeoglobus sulfaticallidus]AGK61549.1 Rubrerythrin [Archaeoglobus sulfaticallidus PM70-1]